MTERFTPQAETIDEEGVWRPGIFQRFSEDLNYGGSTENFKQGMRLEPKGVHLKLLANVERLGKSLKEKMLPSRFLIKLLRQIDPNADPHDVIKTQLQHTANVVTVDEDFLKLSPEERIKATLATDGLITNIESHPLYITAGDCAPVAIFDPENRAIGLFHSGWKGTADLISIVGIKNMIEKYGSNPEDLVVSIGPSIAAEDYEVDETVRNKFEENYSPEEISILFTSHPQEGKFFLNVPLAIKIKLLQAGVREENIEISGHSTFKEGSVFPSARKAKGVQNIDASIFLMSLAKRD